MELRQFIAVLGWGFAFARNVARSVRELYMSTAKVEKGQKAAQIKHLGMLFTQSNP